VLVYLYEVSLGDRVQGLLSGLGVTPAAFTDPVSAPPILIPAYFTLLTSLFLHGGFMHLAGNMLYLWIFGDNVEDSLGPPAFVGFYLACGVIASITHIVLSPNSPIPTIGASGAIAGVLGAYLTLYPRARILTLIPLGFFLRFAYLPSLLVLGFWFVLQLFYGVLSLPGGQMSGGVAWFAHVGGFVCGLILVRVFRRRGRGGLQVG
jgi:membrane associated rhomboid family serine protease